LTAHLRQAGRGCTWPTSATGTAPSANQGRGRRSGHPTRQGAPPHLPPAGRGEVDFDGGEPTLNPELIPLVRYAREIGYRRINVTTNGRLAFYEDFAKKLVRSGLTTLLFSVHGPDAQSHAAQVGVAEAFDQTTGGIRDALKFVGNKAD
jgi:hypothetical protein